MSTVQIAALIVSLTALLAYVNARFIKLPPQIGLLAIALTASLVVVALDALGLIDASHIRDVVEQANFGPTLLHGMLGFLLFAGALHIRIDELAAQKWTVLALSLGGTLISTVLVASAIYGVLAALGHQISALDALLFGALISPTDPIAVLGVLKRSKVPRTLAVQISGESLFNDGIGVVICTVLLAVAAGDHVSGGDVVMLFAREAVGGALFGLILGLIGDRLLRAIDEYTVEVLVTLALVLGGYVAAETIHVSAPIGAVVAGIVIGNRTPRTARPHHLDLWEVIDEILNAVLFLMLGLEATRLRVSLEVAIAAACAVPLVLGARFVSVAASLAALRPLRVGQSHALAILTWGGLRGGLSVALALSLPPGAARDTILLMTYAVVAFAILVQGLTLSLVLKRLGLTADGGGGADAENSWDSRAEHS
ncbi:MAG: nhaP [Myxococcales bacterium]|nr:nhaP [Myxococcales bacterium]